MATTGGNEGDIEGLVTDLIYLERDAIAAYESSIEKLSAASLSGELAKFLRDHRQHLDVLNEIARVTGAHAPLEGDAKQMLTTGKIALAHLVGDAAILKAMKTHEDDTVTAYERAATHPDAIPKSKAFFEKALADERRHGEWMEQTYQAL